MGEPEKIPIEERKKLNKLYREGQITRKQLMKSMKNGLFDHERLAVRKKFNEWIKNFEFID